MAWAKNGTPDTLGSAATGMNISDTSSSIFNVVLTHGINVTGDCAPRMRFNTASGSVYSRRWSDNGGADGTAVSQTYQYWYAGSSIGNLFQIAYVVGIAGEEKLSIVHNVWGATAGAGTAPARTEVVSKWAETSSSITSFNVDSGGTYWDTDSNMSALGSDLTPAAAIPFPSDVQVGSRAEITDTRKMYYRVLGLKYEDDFSTDNWTDNDSTNMGVSGGTFNWNAKRDGSNDASVYDLGSVVSDNWVLRFKLTVTNVSSSTQAGNGFFVGLSDSDQTVSHGTSQDFIGVSIYNDNADTYRAIDADGSAIPDVYSGDSSQTTTYNTGSVWYYEIIKTGSSYTVEAFSNSDYSTGSEGQITGSSNASGLQYLKIINDDMSIPTSTNPFQGTINDLKFYNGVTSSTGNAWQELGT